MADKNITSVVVVPSYGDHPDDFEEAIRPGYWPHANLAKECNFVIHRISDGRVEVHDMDRPVRDGVATVVFLGAGNRRLSPAEVESFETLVQSLRKEKRISGRLKQTVNGGLLFKEDEVVQQDLPDNRDTTPPEETRESPEPAPAPSEDDRARTEGRSEESAAPEDDAGDDGGAEDDGGEAPSKR